MGSFFHSHLQSSKPMWNWGFENGVPDANVPMRILDKHNMIKKYQEMAYIYSYIVIKMWPSRNMIMRTSSNINPLMDFFADFYGFLWILRCAMRYASNVPFGLGVPSRLWGLALHITWRRKSCEDMAMAPRRHVWVLEGEELQLSLRLQPENIPSGYLT